MKTPQPWLHPLGAILLRVQHCQEQNSIQGNDPCGSSCALHFTFFFRPTPHARRPVRKIPKNNGQKMEGM